MTTERTVAFVDLAGFTALTNVHGDQAAVDLVDDFARITAEAADANGAELVKTIGDAVMLAAETPESALAVVREVFHATYERDGFPELRAGMHHGPVVVREADYFGATVNLAARVASRAGSGQALITEVIVPAAYAADVEAVPLGAQQLRNIVDPVDLWALELCGSHIDLAIDPVCRMRLSCQAAVANVRYDDVDHRFCSLACVAQFASDPDRYITPTGS